jgi:AP-2 complex subunit beta-1
MNYIGKVQELRAELNAGMGGGGRKPKLNQVAIALKKIIANITMGNDMSPLFSDVIECLSLSAPSSSYSVSGKPSGSHHVLEVKKMVYLFLVSYAKGKQDLFKTALPGITKVF